MLSIQVQIPHDTFSFPPFRHVELTPIAASQRSFYQAQSSMGGTYPHMGSSVTQPSAAQTAENIAVAQALEIARESPDGAQDPTVNGILEAALAKIWTKVLAQPNQYVMTRDEFAVFNFYQQRFVGDKTAVAARKRYWDNTTA